MKSVSLTFTFQETREYEIQGSRQIPRQASPVRIRRDIEGLCRRPTTQDCVIAPEYKQPQPLFPSQDETRSTIAALATSARSAFKDYEGQNAQTLPRVQGDILPSRRSNGMRPLKISHQYNTNTPASAIVHNARAVSVEQLMDIILRTTTMPTSEKEYEFISAVAFALQSLRDVPEEQNHLDTKVRLALVGHSICAFFNAAVSRTGSCRRTPILTIWHFIYRETETLF